MFFSSKLNEFLTGFQTDVNISKNGTHVGNFQKNVFPKYSIKRCCK